MTKTSQYECSKWFAKSGKIEDSSERYQHSLVNFGRGAGMNTLAFSLGDPKKKPVRQTRWIVGTKNFPRWEIGRLRWNHSLGFRLCFVCSRGGGPCGRGDNLPPSRTVDSSFSLEHPDMYATWWFWRT